MPSPYTAWSAFRFWSVLPLLSGREIGDGVSPPAARQAQKEFWRAPNLARAATTIEFLELTSIWRLDERRYDRVIVVSQICSQGGGDPGGHSSRGP
jgi:hypothetical protein